MSDERKSRRICPFCLGKPVGKAEFYMVGNRLKSWSDRSACPMCEQDNNYARKPDIAVTVEKSEELPNPVLKDEVKEGE